MENNILVHMNDKKVVSELFNKLLISMHFFGDEGDSCATL